MTLKKVKTGDRLRIGASTFNAFIDAAAAHQHSQRNIATQPRTKSDASKVLVRNSTGQDLPRFSVLGIDNVLIDPAAQLERFCAQVAFDGVVPTSDHLGGRIVITAEPIAAGKLGKAYASGCCPAYIDMAAEGDTCANAIEADATKLTSAGNGPLSILWAEEGVGEKWAVVRFGSVGGSSLQLWQIVVPPASDDPRQHYYQCRPVYLDNAKITAGTEDPRYTNPGDGGDDPGDEIVEVLHIGAFWDAGEDPAYIPYNRLPYWSYMVGYETTDDAGATVRVGWSTRHAFGA